MNQDLLARLSRRYLVLDIHKHYSILGRVDFERNVILEPLRVEHADLPAWLKNTSSP